MKDVTDLMLKLFWYPIPLRIAETGLNILRDWKSRDPGSCDFQSHFKKQQLMLSCVQTNI